MICARRSFTLNDNFAGINDFISISPSEEEDEFPWEDVVMCLSDKGAPSNHSTREYNFSSLNLKGLINLTYPCDR